MDPKPKRQPVPAGGQPTPDTIAAADATPPAVTPPAATPSAETPAAERPADAERADYIEWVEARVLVAFDDHDANDIFTAPAEEVERQKLAGNVDPHPDAVAYAKSLLA